MSQLKLSVRAQDSDDARTLMGLLGEVASPAPIATSQFESGAAGEQIVEAYFAIDEKLDSVIQLLAESGACAGSIALSEVADANWVAISQAALPPVVAGRFVVHGSHDLERIGRRPGAILIDAGEAFGTAHHATTHGCLLALEHIARRERITSVLDLGCGSGVLAIAAARLLPGAEIIASDIDSVAVDVARENIDRNGVGDRIDVVVAKGFDHPSLRGEARYDLVIANILADPLVDLARQMRRSIVPGGFAILSGLLVHQSSRVVAAYRAAGFRMVQNRTSAGWAAITLCRRS
jgi:ribosomal protein L11 methyltransferase